MQARRLILTADDFGRSPAVNAAVEEWFRAGAITHASLMVNEPHAAAAVAIARRLPGLQLGLHLTLCDGLASDGAALPRTPLGAGLQFAFRPGARPWLRREILAQFTRFSGEFGLTPSHWDGHCHLHLHPVVMALALPVAQAAGFKSTRLLQEPGAPSLLALIFRSLSRRVSPALKAAGMEVAGQTFGFRRSGRMRVTDVLQALRYPGAETKEIYFHPGAERHLRNPRDVVLALRTAEPVADTSS